MKFWNWMKEKKYGELKYEEHKIYDLPGGNMRMCVTPTPQMLVGYMLEYIRDHEWWNRSDIAEIIKCDMARDVGMIVFCRDQKAECERIVKEMDGEE